MSRLKIDPSIFNIPKNIAVTGRIKSWLVDLQQTINQQDDNWFNTFINRQLGYDINHLRRLPVSCTVYVVGDSMDEIENSIEHSWSYTSHALRNGAGVAIHLSNLRPKNTPNGKGLVSSGPVSFAQIYSKLNEILRRGGTFRNGAVVVHLDYDHPDIVEFATAPRELLPWARRAINVDEGFLNHPQLDVLLKSVETGDCFLVKKQYDKHGERLYHNVCVTGDTWVTTEDGPKQVKELVDKPFKVILNNQYYSSSQKGFWSNGIKPVFKLTTSQGYEVEATGDHKFLSVNDKWIELQHLVKGDTLKVNQLRDINYEWSGNGNFEQGWLLGNLLGDGTFATTKSSVRGILSYWGENRLAMLNRALDFLNKECVVITKRRTYASIGGDNAEKEIAKVNSKGLAILAESFGIYPVEKSITNLIESASSDFCKGFLQGYYDADGTVSHGTKKGSGRQISITSVISSNLKAVQRILLRFGIHSKLRLDKYNGSKNLLPDGKGGHKLYNTKKASRLDITGRLNIERFQEVIDFSEPSKKEKLINVINSFKDCAYTKAFTADVSSVEYIGLKEVFDCTINDAHAFDANGLIAHNCVEITISHRSTCLLSHVNLGALKIEDIVPTFIDGMNWLCRVHGSTGVDLGGYYLSPKEDKQVGLGVIGLANLLAIEGITYDELVRGMERVLGVSQLQTSEKGYTLAWTLYRAYQESAKVARMYGQNRAFCVAPTANCSFKYKDREFYVTTPEIAPPVDISVERDSQTMGVLEVDYHPDCEIASEVGWDIYYRLNKCWQMYMDSTGLGHAISTNWWSDKIQMNKEFVTDWINSPLKSLYYAWQVSPQVQDKSEILTSDNFELEHSEECLPCMIKKQEQESAYNTECSACAE
jgi:ribonucleoside-diphosphate reductase alpha chain